SPVTCAATCSLSNLVCSTVDQNSKSSVFVTNECCSTRHGCLVIRFFSCCKSTKRTKDFLVDFYRDFLCKCCHDFGFNVKSVHSLCILCSFEGPACAELAALRFYDLFQDLHVDALTWYAFKRCSVICTAGRAVTRVSSCNLER